MIWVRRAADGAVRVLMGLAGDWWFSWLPATGRE